LDANIILDLEKICVEYGLNPYSTDFEIELPPKMLPVMLDGKLIGYIDQAHAISFELSLRALKVE
jgi:hypothetical protein